MILSEVQRTLVKSPPELWAEISDPESLARHLGEFGEIRITRVHPEQKVEWEAGETSGTIAIKPSGWGTKVKLTVTREPAQPELTSEPEQEPEPGQASEPEQISEPEQVPQPEPASEPYQAPDSEQPGPEAEHEPAPAAAGEAEDARVPAPGPEPRRGFFARLFRRRRAPRELEPESLELAFETHREIAADELAAGYLVHPADAIATEPSPDAEPPEDAAADLTAEPEHAEEVASEQVTAVLTGVLDRLGAAHHRPFSRA